MSADIQQKKKQYTSTIFSDYLGKTAIERYSESGNTSTTFFQYFDGVAMVVCHDSKNSNSFITPFHDFDKVVHFISIFFWFFMSIYPFKVHLSNFKSLYFCQNYRI